MDGDEEGTIVHRINTTYDTSVYPTHVIWTVSIICKNGVGAWARVVQDVPATCLECLADDPITQDDYCLDCQDPHHTACGRESWCVCCVYTELKQ